MDGAKERNKLVLLGRITHFDHRRLLYLQAAVAAGSVRGGAERLRTSPSALSRQIAKMEEELQIPLLERHGRGVRPTDAGTLLIEYLVQQQSQLDHVVGQIWDIVGLRRGVVSIAVGEGFIEELIGHPLRTFAQHHPQLRIDLQFGGTDEIIRRVTDGSAHIGLVYNPPSEPRIQSHASKAHSMCVVTNPNHPLTRIPRKLVIEDLQDCDLAVTPGNFGIRQVLMVAEAQGGPRLFPRVTASSSRFLNRFVEEWNGVILQPRFAVAREIENGSVVAMELDNDHLARAEVHLITQRGRRLPVSAEHLLRHMRATISILH